MPMRAVNPDDTDSRLKGQTPDAPVSQEIIDLLLRAMSLADGDEHSALSLVKQASSLVVPHMARKERSGHNEANVSGGLAAWQVSRLKVYVADNISSAITLDELARIVRLSTSYFSTAFKVSFGISPHNYIIAQRVEYAKRMMRETETPLCVIALECGLSDQAHLSRVFRRITGTTPNAWRRYNRAGMPSCEYD